MPDSLLPWISSSTILPVIHLSCSLLNFPTSSPHSPRGSEDRALRPPRHLEMVSEDGKTRGGTNISYLDASSSCCCQWISELVNLPSYLLTYTYLLNYLLSCLLNYLVQPLTHIPTILFISLLTCFPCSSNNTIITIICQFYCFSVASTELFYPNLAAGCW